MILHHIYAIAISAVILSSLPSVSQGEMPDDAEDSSAAIRFACVAWDELSYEEIFFRGGGEFHPLKLNPGKCSELYSLEGVDSLELHIRKEDSAGEEIYELIGSAPLIKGAEQLLFLIEEAEDSGSLPLLLHGLDDSWETFPVGAFRFVNYTTNPLQVEFGDVSAELPPQVPAIVKSQVPVDGGLIVFYLKDAKGDSVYENRLFGQPTQRQTVAIYAPLSEGGRMDFKFIWQRPPLDTSDILNIHTTLPDAPQTAEILP